MCAGLWSVIGPRGKRQIDRGGPLKPAESFLAYFGIRWFVPRVSNDTGVFLRLAFRIRVIWAAAVWDKGLSSSTVGVWHKPHREKQSPS